MFTILNNKVLIKKMGFNDNIKVFYIIENLDECCIIFNYGFLEYFFNEAIRYANNILKRNNMIYWTIFYCWMEIVFLHEFSHLVRKHFDLLANDKSFNELAVRQSKLNNKKVKCLEIDANRYAGKFFAGISSLSFKKLKQILNYESDIKLRTITLLSGFQECKFQEKIFLILLI